MLVGSEQIIVPASPIQNAHFSEGQEGVAPGTPGSEPEAVFTLVTASAFFDDVKVWSAPYFDPHQLGVRLKFDVDVNKAAVDVQKT